MNVANPVYISPVARFIRENAAKTGEIKVLPDGTKVRTFVDSAGKQIAQMTTKVIDNGAHRVTDRTLTTVNGMEKNVHSEMNFVNGYFYNGKNRLLFPKDASHSSVTKDADGLVVRRAMSNYKLHTEALCKGNKYQGIDSYNLENVDLTPYKEMNTLEFLHLREQGVPVHGYSRKALSNRVIDNGKGNYKNIWVEEDFGPVKEIGKKPSMMTPLGEFAGLN